MRPPKHFLLRDDLTDCAEHVISILRHRPQQSIFYNVYVAADGGIRVIRKDAVDANQRPESELLGVYDKTVRIEVVEDDLLARKRELIAANAAYPLRIKP